MCEKNITFILHKPQLSENIGACARAIKNFNFKKLVLINPKPIFPNDKILATSVGAKDIINNARVFENIENSLAKIDILIATSARFRNKNIKHISLSDLNKIDYSKKIGFLFGSFLIFSTFFIRLSSTNGPFQTDLAITYALFFFLLLIINLSVLLLSLVFNPLAD